MASAVFSVVWAPSTGAVLERPRTNNDGKLVISFDKYEVAPGYMGVLEFIIPTQCDCRFISKSCYIK
ncbi:RsiV family protein [Paenibacillus donghaensis]|uniref:RsiV family protein n=1 Tax=Paenibacillus donghaensis TaxID=414771 RepID=UPI003A100BC0